MSRRPDRPGRPSGARSRRTRGRLRLFVAADPPASIREEVAAWGRHVARTTAGLRPVPAGNCHLTLAFLGERPETDLEPIRDAVRLAAGPRPDLTRPRLALGAPVWLPPKRPRALALEVHDDQGDLAGLERDLAAGLERAIGWRSGRKFRPHLTAVRTSRGFDPGSLRLPRSPALEFEPEAVVLCSSVLRPDGARYETLERVDLI